jgi:hypothetical protein
MSNKTHFEFEIGDAATVTISAEHGTGDGRADYSSGENYFRLRYVQANGCAALKWFPASELSKA